jgi:peroxiredoxin
MKLLRSKALLAGVSVAVLGAMAMNATAQRGTQDVVGTTAPAISAQGTDGKTHTLQSLTKDGPIVLYFIKIACPVNHQAAPHFKAIHDAYKGKARIVGVINGSVDDGKKWASQYNTNFLILSDPNKKIIGDYKAVHSPWAIHVEGGKIAKVWNGGTAAQLTEINRAMAGVAKQTPANLDWRGAPSRPGG